jgi:hypothetical protein
MGRLVMHARLITELFVRVGVGERRLDGVRDWKMDGGVLVPKLDTALFV